MSDEQQSLPLGPMPKMAAKPETKPEKPRTPPASTQTPSGQLLRYFKYDHLPQPLQDLSYRCSSLARYMEDALPDGPEKTMGLRKLLEAKDCFVRAALPQEGEAYIGGEQR